MNLRIIRKDDAYDSHRTLAATGLSPPPKKNGVGRVPKKGQHNSREHGYK